jgi:hypothetical protein
MRLQRSAPLSLPSSQPVLGPELPVAEPAAVDDARQWPASGATAWNGSAYLVVADSVAWRLDADANALDRLPFRVPATGSVASNGSDWLIA